MKKITYIIVLLILAVSYSYGQGEIEANQFSRGDLYGTARSISMGGAFGALGGDLTGVAINPAGIAVYRSSEVSATAVFSNEKFKATGISNSKSNFNINNMGFVGYFPTRNYNVPVVNFGFSYNKVKSFDRKIESYGADRGSSIMDYMALQGEGYKPNDMLFDDNDKDYDPFQSGAPWLPILGLNSSLLKANIDGDGINYYTPVHDETVSNYLLLSESGSIDTYDFTVGTSINNVLNLGVSLTLTDINYRLNSQNSEDFAAGGDSGFDLHNFLATDGNGVGVKLGLIYRPINAFRFGLSYQSPTWYKMTDRYSASIVTDVTDYVDGVDGILDPYSAEFRNDYDFKTPDKWTASAAAVIGTNMILSLDYELTNYKSMKFSEPSGIYVKPEESYDENANLFIKDGFKYSSTLRAGFEYRFTPQFSGRLGYAWMQNPYDSTLKEKGDAMVSGSTTAYRLEGDANYFTAGIGYRFNRNFYADLAIVYKTQEDDLYSYPNVFADDDRTDFYINAEPYNLTNNSFRGLLTLGYRF